MKDYVLLDRPKVELHYLRVVVITESYTLSLYEKEFSGLTYGRYSQ